MKKWNLIIALLFSIALSSLFAQSNESKKVLLVLGSGGSKGLAHVGVIEELENLGILPDVIVGCSAGAIVGALYAQDQDIAKVKEILINLKQNDLLDFKLFQKFSIFTNDKMEDFLDENLTVKDFGSLKIPFIAVATDLQKGEPVYFEEGELRSVVLASAAIPGLFPPYQIEDKLYIDGGACDPLPVRFAKSLGDFVVIASDISAPIQGFKVKNLPQLLRKSFEVMYQRLAFFDKQEADILLEMNFPENISSPFEDRFNQQIYEQGKEAVRNQSEEILKMVFVSDDKG